MSVKRVDDLVRRRLDSGEKSPSQAQTPKEVIASIKVEKSKKDQEGRRPSKELRRPEDPLSQSSVEVPTGWRRSVTPSDVLLQATTPIASLAVNHGQRLRNSCPELFPTTKLEVDAPIRSPSKESASFSDFPTTKLEDDAPTRSPSKESVTFSDKS